MIYPGQEILIYDEDAEKSAELKTYLNSAILVKTGMDEPIEQDLLVMDDATNTISFYQPGTGIKFPGGLSYDPLKVGVWSSVTPSIGAVLNVAHPYSIQLSCDDGNSAIASSITTPLFSRYLLTHAQASGATQTALYSQLKTVGSLTFAGGGIRGAYIFNQAGTITLSGNAEYVILNAACTTAGTMTVGSGCSFVGVDINIAGSGSIANSGTCAALLIRNKTAETPVWTNGIQIANSGCVTGISIGTATTGISGTGTFSNGILFTGQLDYSAANRNMSYIGIGTYASHLLIDLSASNTSARAYLMQLMVDSVANDSSGNYIMGFYPRINVTTADQPNISFSALSPSITAVKNFKAIRCLKSEVDISDAGVTTTLEGCYAVSGYLKVGTSGTLTGGGTSVATGIFDFDGGTGLTLAGGSRTFAIFGNIYTGATATGNVLLRIDGTGILTSAMVTMECQTGTCPYAFSFDDNSRSQFVSTASGGTPTNPVAIDVLVNGAHKKIIAADSWA
jgi:hypothetical protein